jgi:hypothetical protein
MVVLVVPVHQDQQVHRVHKVERVVLDYQDLPGLLDLPEQLVPQDEQEQLVLLESKALQVLLVEPVRLDSKGLWVWQEILAEQALLGAWDQLDEQEQQVYLGVLAGLEQLAAQDLSDLKVSKATQATLVGLAPQVFLVLLVLRGFKVSKAYKGSVVELDPQVLQVGLEQLDNRVPLVQLDCKD